MGQYNKLVRDRIPDIIRQNGEQPIVRVLTHEEYLNELTKKFHEEADELAEAMTVEELADLQEVVFAFRDALNISPEELEAVRRNKAAKRGGFVQRIYLEGVE